MMMTPEHVKLTMSRLGWRPSPLVATLDFEHEQLITQKHTYPFRDLSQTAIQHFKDQTVINGIPIDRVPLTNRLLSLEESVYEDSLGSVIRPELPLSSEEYDAPRHLLEQAFIYEMFLVTEMERRLKGVMSKDEMLHEAATLSNGMPSMKEKVDEIEHEYEEQDVLQR